MNRQGIKISVPINPFPWKKRYYVQNSWNCIKCNKIGLSTHKSLWLKKKKIRKKVFYNNYERKFTHF